MIDLLKELSAAYRIRKGLPILPGSTIKFAVDTDRKKVWWGVDDEWYKAWWKKMIRIVLGRARDRYRQLLARLRPAEPINWDKDIEDELAEVGEE